MNYPTSMRNINAAVCRQCFSLKCYVHVPKHCGARHVGTAISRTLAASSREELKLHYNWLGTDWKNLFPAIDFWWPLLSPSHKKTREISKGILGNIGPCIERSIEHWFNFMWERCYGRRKLQVRLMKRTRCSFIGTSVDVTVHVRQLLCPVISSGLMKSHCLCHLNRATAWDPPNVFIEVNRENSSYVSHFVFIHFLVLERSPLSIRIAPGTICSFHDVKMYGFLINYFCASISCVPYFYNSRHICDTFLNAAKNPYFRR